MFCKIYRFPMRFCSSDFENRQLTVVSTDSSCSGWFWITTADSSYGWFALRRLIWDFRRLIWDLRLNWPPPEFWPRCLLICILVTVMCDYLVIPLKRMINNCLLHMRQFKALSVLTWYQFVTKTPSYFPTPQEVKGNQTMKFDRLILHEKHFS